jgi:hypothetical protein
VGPAPEHGVERVPELVVAGEGVPAAGGVDAGAKAEPGDRHRLARAVDDDVLELLLCHLRRVPVGPCENAARQHPSQQRDHEHRRDPPHPEIARAASVEDNDEAE